MPGAQGPGLHASGKLAYDSARRRVVLFGGLDGNNAGLNDTWEYYNPYPAALTPFGAGCAGSAGTPALAAVNGSLPWIGTTLLVDLAPIPTSPFVNIPFYLLGGSNVAWGPFPLPLSLAPLGMPGCSMLVTPDFNQALVNLGGSARIALPIPSQSSLLGQTVHLQGGVLDAPANALGVVVSNGATVTVGAQ
jgi:hypothetical protein